MRQCRADVRFTSNSGHPRARLKLAARAGATCLANLQRTFEDTSTTRAVDLAQCVAALREQAERVKEVRHDQLSDGATIHVS